MQAQFEDIGEIGVIRQTPGGASYLSEDGWKVIPLSREDLQKLISGSKDADQRNDGHDKP